MEMKIIGLTGGSGSGKSTVTRLLDQLTKIYIIDADKIGHQIILKGKPAYYEIIKEFGKNILKEDGNINRKLLGKAVFSNPTALDLLNRITHPRIREEILEKITQIKLSSCSYKYIIIDAALLIEVGLHEIVDEVWVVYADLENRIQRIMARDGLSKREAEDRIRVQMPWKEMKRYANRIIDNGQDKEFVKSQLCFILEDI